MAGRKHSEQSKKRISEARRGKRDHITEQYRQSLRDGHRRRQISDPDFMRRVALVVHTYRSTHSYAEAGRAVGLDTSSARKLYLKWNCYYDSNSL